MMTMAITQAKTGRSRKNFESMNGLRLFRFGGRLCSLHGLRILLLAGIERDYLHGGTGPRFLNSFDNQAISRFQPLADQPLVADGAVDHDLSLRNFLRAIHNQRDGISFRITGHRLLRNQDGLLDQTPSWTMARTYMPGSSICLGFGKTVRRMNDPVLGSTVTSENFSVPSSG